MTPDLISGSFDEIADLAEELHALHATSSGVMSRAWPAGSNRGLLDGGEPAFSAELWSTLVRLGWTDVLVSDGAGGGASGLRQLCVLSEVVGAAAAPVPLAAVAGAAWCLDAPATAIALALPTPARLTAGTVSGAWPAVPYGALAERLVCLARSDDQIVLAIVDPTGAGVRRDAVTPLDHNPAARIVLDAAPAEVLCHGDAALERYVATMHRVRLATAAELIGVAAAANDAAAAYARNRMAFGRPIGAYQAIKHRLVDQRTSIEICRALVNRAASAADRGSADPYPLVSLACYWAIDRLRAVPEGAIQVFGGIGYTWEHEAHIHLRRAACLASSLGSRAEHREQALAWLRRTRP